MKKGLILITLCFILAISLISAQDENCFESITATKTDAFINQLTNINLDNCNSEVPSPINRVFSNEVINLVIIRQDGTRQDLTLIIEDGQVTSIEQGSSDNPSFVITIEECSLETILRNKNAGTAAYLYSSGHITVGPHGFWNIIRWNFGKLILNPAMRRMTVETEIECTDGGKKAVGEVCNHGGECETGNCIYVGGEGADRTYKCSCDPFKYDPYVNSDGSCVGELTYPESNTGKPGDICQHGGQCETGNCIYQSGQGADRIYKCSCDPYRLDTASC